MNYALAKVADFSEFEGRKIGLLIRCPNCGVEGAAYFDSPIGGGLMPQWARVRWARTGDALESMTLQPSFLMHGHFHSWVRNGQLMVDSQFSCKGDGVAQAETDSAVKKFKETEAELFAFLSAKGETDERCVQILLNHLEAVRAEFEKAKAK